MWPTAHIVICLYITTIPRPKLVSDNNGSIGETIRLWGTTYARKWSCPYWGKTGTEEGHKPLSVHWLRFEQHTSEHNSRVLTLQQPALKRQVFAIERHIHSYVVVTCSCYGVHRWRGKKWVTRPNYMHFVSKSTPANTAGSNAGFSRFSSVVTGHASLPSRLYAIIWRHAMVFHSWWAGSDFPARPSRKRLVYARPLQVVQMSECEQWVGGLYFLHNSSSQRLNAYRKTNGFFFTKDGTVCRLPVTIWDDPQMLPQNNNTSSLWLLR